MYGLGQNVHDVNPELNHRGNLVNTQVYICASFLYDSGIIGASSNNHQNNLWMEKDCIFKDKIPLFMCFHFLVDPYTPYLIQIT